VALSETLGIANRVLWHGSIPQAQLPNWYRTADVCVLPSRSEGVPNVLLEASGCNTPWVATRVGGIPEIAHLGVNRIVAVESAEELAEAVSALLALPASSGLSPRGPEAAVQEIFEFLTNVQNQCQVAGPTVATCSR
jgi:glycosyltransferase involved in cell wall biosynthesis